MKKKFFKKRFAGFSLIESLVTLAVFALLVTFVASTLTQTEESQIRFSAKERAEALLLESSEAVSSIRNQNFLLLQNGIYGLQLNQGVFSFLGTPDLIDQFFTRKITIADVYRDPATSDIADQGTLDLRSKKVTIEISWQSDLEGNKSLSVTSYFSDWYSKDLIFSTLSDWSLGTHNQTRMSSTGNGALILDDQAVSWESSVHESSQLFHSNQNANANAFTVVNNKGYLVSDYQGGFDNFIVLEVSNPSSVQNLGSIALGESVSGLDVLVANSKAYVATNHGSKELLILDVTNPAFPIIQTIYNFPRNTAAQSLALKEQLLFVGMQENSDRELYILDITDAQNPVRRGSFEVHDTVNDLVVSGTTAYLAVNDDEALWILDVTNLSDIRVLSRTRSPDESPGKALALKDNILYFLSRAGLLQTFDITNGSAPIRLGSFNLNAPSSGLDVFSTHAFLATSKNNEEFQIIDTENPAQLFLSDTVDLNGTGNTVFANLNAVFVTSDNNTSPLSIYSYPRLIIFDQGTFTSSVFDSTLPQPKWQSLSFEALIPGGTSVRFQLRTGDTEAHLLAAPFTGPDRTGATFYTAPSSIITLPENISGTRFLQYRVLMTSQGTSTPEISSIRFQYLP